MRDGGNEDGTETTATTQGKPPAKSAIRTDGLRDHGTEAPTRSYSISMEPLELLDEHEGDDELQRAKLATKGHEGLSVICVTDSDGGRNEGFESKRLLLPPVLLIFLPRRGYCWIVYTSQPRNKKNCLCSNLCLGSPAPFQTLPLRIAPCAGAGMQSGPLAQPVRWAWGCHSVTPLSVLDRTVCLVTKCAFTHTTGRGLAGRTARF